MAVDLSHVEELSKEEVDAAMQEMYQAERCRVFRDMLNEGLCGFCGGQTLRLILTGGRLAISCPCGFK